MFNFLFDLFSLVVCGTQRFVSDMSACHDYNVFDVFEHCVCCVHVIIEPNEFMKFTSSVKWLEIKAYRNKTKNCSLHFVHVMLLLLLLLLLWWWWWWCALFSFIIFFSFFGYTFSTKDKQFAVSICSCVCLCESYIVSGQSATSHPN